jgi:hypothetical protein
MVGLALIIVALALVLGGEAGVFVDLLWWAAILLATASAIRIFSVSHRDRLRSEDSLDGLGGIADLMERHRVQRARADARAEWSSSD